MEQTNEHNRPKANLGVPIAIVIAGLLIGGAILLSNKQNGGSIGSVQSLDTVLQKIAKSVGINSSEFKKCLSSGKYKDKINSSIKDAISSGGNGTPWSVVIGPTGKRYPLSGARPVEEVTAIIDKAAKDVPTGLTREETATLATMPEVTATDHIRGSIGAPVKIVEYSDLECPFCKMFHETLKEVTASYGDKVAWVYRPFPLSQLHSMAPKEAEAAECASEIGGNEGFWKFVDKINEITPANNRLNQADI